MKHGPKPLLFIAVAVTLFLLFYGLFRYQQSVGGDSPKAHNGLLDLSDWDFAANGTIPLDGDWAFYWNQIVPPNELVKPTGFYNVPGNWHGSVNGTTLKPKGAATYRLTVKLPPHESQAYALRVTYIRMASAVFVNGTKVGGSGLPLPSRSTYEPVNVPFTSYFSIDSGETTVDIVVQTANYDFQMGGISKSIYMGHPASIQSKERKEYTLELGGILSLTLMGLYHIGAYKRRRKQGLYFGLFAIDLALTISCFDNKLFMQWLPWLPFEIEYKIQALSLYSCPLFLILFIKEISSGLLPLRLARYSLILFAAIALAVIILPFRLYSYMGTPLSVLGLLIYAGLIGILVILYLRKQYGELSKNGMFLLICAICLIMIGCVDMTLFVTFGSPDATISIICSVLFAGLISQMLTSRFSAAFETIEQMSQQLLTLDKLKDEFLANTSHEFQTPLNGIINISQFLLEGNAGMVTDKQVHNLSIIYSQARKLSSLTRDILDMEQLKHNGLVMLLEPLNIRTAVSVVLDVFDFLVAGKQVQITQRIPEHLFVNADENRFFQIVNNLLGNAVKFTEAGTISITAERQGDQIVLAIEDTGIGIAADRQDRIFTWYEQAERSITEEYGGTGLGLPISRRLAELMAGRLELDWSQPGQGSRFILILQAAETVAAPAEVKEEAPKKPPWQHRPSGTLEAAAALSGYPQTEASTGDKHPTLLIVDDQPVNLQALMNVLEADSYHVISANSGQEALDLIRTRGDIRLVLLDVVMPRMSGYEVCRSIRLSHSLFDMPVIMLTARRGLEDVATGFEAGANDYLLKPFHSAEIRARVRTLLQLQQSVRKAIASEMSFLQSQIKPHFLYNALNTVLHFIYIQDPRSAEIVNHLSQYLRNSFDIPGTETFVSLQKELELVHAYVEIEKARFGDRLDIRFEVDDSLLGMMVLPLTIQPLVENAIRHGVTKRLEGGTVSIMVKAQLETVRVEVRDNGVGIANERFKKLLMQPDTNDRKGVGLNNIHSRLQRIYGEELHIESIEDQGTNVYYVLKKERGRNFEERNHSG